MPSSNILDAVASDLAVWLDQESTRIAAAMAPQGTAPFAASLSEQQKLEYYRAQLFNDDGTPNLKGRSDQMNRLGPEGFTQVYKAVIKAYPQLKVPNPPMGAPPGPMEPPPMMGPPPGPPGMPPGIPAMAAGGVVTEPTLALIGEAGPEAVVPLDQYQPQAPGISSVLAQVPDLVQVISDAARSVPGITHAIMPDQWAAVLRAANAAGGALHLGPDVLPYAAYDQYLKQSGLDWRQPPRQELA